MKKKLFNEIIYFFFISAFFFSASVFLFQDYIDSHWTASFDQEIVLTYNALLFNSGIEQEMTDHSAYFTILFTSFFYKILNFVGLNDVYKFSQITELNLNQIFEQNVYYLRLLSIFMHTFAFLATTYFFLNYFKDKIFSFFLSVIVFFLYGNLSLIYGVRPELISYIFLISSLIFIFRFLEKNNIFDLFIFFLLIFCSILNKLQVIFYFPFILLFSYFNLKTIYSTNIFNRLDVKKEKILKYIFIFLFLYISLKSFVFLRDYKTWIFLLLLISIMNLFFYKVSSKKNISDNLIILNLCLIFSYVFFNLIVFLHPSASLISINTTIFSVVKSASQYNSVTSSLSLSMLDFLINLSLLFIKNFFLIFQIIFKTLNSYSLILLILVILFFFNYRKFSNKEKFLILSLLISYFSIFGLNLLRGNFPNYYIYNDYILVFLAGIVFYKLIRNFSYLICIGIIFFNVYINFDKKFIVIRDNSLMLCKELNDNPNNHFETWQKQMPVEKFNDYCLNYN